MALYPDLGSMPPTGQLALPLLGWLDVAGCASQTPACLTIPCILIVYRRFLREHLRGRPLGGALPRHSGARSIRCLAEEQPSGGPVDAEQVGGCQVCLH